MKEETKLNSKVIKLYKQTKDALSSDVVSCFNTDLMSIHASLVYLDQLFKKKGLKNDASNLVEKGLEDISSWFSYFDILRFELINYRENNKALKIEVDRLRKENMLLKQDNILNK